MKNFLILGILSVITNLALGQNREILRQNKFNSETFKTYEIEVKKKWFDSVKINSSGNVQFVDARADKSKLGFVRMGENLLYYNMVLPEESVGYINSKFQHVLKEASNQNNLKIVIRHLWMSHLITNINPNKKGTPIKEYVSYCYFKADYYDEKNGLVEFIGQLDTVFSRLGWMGNASDKLIKKVLVTALNACDSFVVLSDNPVFSVKLLSDSLENQFNYPIIKTNEPKKGIYRNYDEFLNNNPIQGEFEVMSEKKETYLLSKTIDTAVTNAAWGYSDGKYIYKHLNDSYYKMNRVQNTFELAGPRQITKIYTNEQKFLNMAIDSFFWGLTGGVMTFIFYQTEEKLMRELVPYQLNIKNGTFY